jgi:hypothetical protein
LIDAADELAPSAASGQGSRARWPGSRVSLAVVVTALAVTLAVVLTRGAATPPAARYGQIPSWLPKPTVAVGRTVRANAAHPWLAVEGDTVVVDLAAGQTRATAVGPSVARSGQYPVPASTACSFTVTFTGASGSVPLRAAAFTIVDELGHVHRPRVHAAGGGRPPALVRPGQAVTLTLSDVLPTGSGQLRWTPAGQTAIVAWDFDVEVD